MSGTACHLLQELATHHPKTTKLCFVQHPSSAFCYNSCINLYNDILTLNHLIDSADMVVDVDDMSLIDVCAKRHASKVYLYNSSFKQFKSKRPTYEDANELLVDAMLGMTSTFRLPTTQNQTMLKFATSLIPYFRLHHFSIS